MLTRSIETPLPPVYRVPRLASGALVIDGNLEKREWQSAPWSDVFDEIRGKDDAPDGSRPPVSCSTRVKMLWDDEYLYVGAILHYGEGMPIVATFTERNSPIFQQDSDFEVRNMQPKGRSQHTAYRAFSLTPRLSRPRAGLY